MLLEVVDEVVDDEEELDVLELDVLFVVDEVEEEVVDDVVLDEVVDDVVEVVRVEEVVVVEPA